MNLEINYERIIAATPERVFDAFTDPEGQREFYGQDDPGWIVDSSCDLRVGGLWSIDFGPSPAELYRHDHIFEAIDPPHRILMGTVETRLDGSTLETSMELKFEPHEDGTLMTLHQTGFPTTELQEEHTRGMPNAFTRLERFIDNHERG